MPGIIILKDYNKVMIKIQVKFLKNILEKNRGLLGYNKAFPALIKTRFGIHTFGMRFPIDILVLNKEGEVVAMKEKLEPNKIFVWSPLYNIVIELPSGQIKKDELRIGDRVMLEII